jgi:MFS family permease
MSEQAIQLLFSSGGFGAVVAALAGGWLVDRFGGPSLIAVTLIAHILLLLGWAAFGGASVAGYTLFGASWIALQIGSVGFASWYTAYVPVRIRGRILGSLGAVGTFVSALGPQIGNAIRNTSLNPGVALHVPLRLASASPFIAALIIAVLLAAQILRMPTRADAAQAFARISGR